MFFYPDPVRIVHNTSAETSLVSPEEKKRKMNEEISPSKLQTSPPSQPVITLLPSGSPTLSMPVGTVISPVSGTGNPQPIILAPSTAGTQTVIQNGPPTILQNGTINGLPTMFQIVNSQNLATSQQAQFVAIAQSQGRSLLTNSFQKTTSLLPPKGVPVLLAPVQLATSVQCTVSGSKQQVMTTPTKLNTSYASPIIGNQQFMVPTSMHSTIHQHNVLKQTLNNKNVIQLANGQVLESGKQTSKEVSSVPNGLYPVTPPRTPEEQRSESGSQQDTAEEMEVNQLIIFSGPEKF